MRTNRSRRQQTVLGLWAIALGLSAGVAMGEPYKLSGQEKSAGFELLFNGKDLTGWKEVQGKAGAFRVEDGVLAGQRGGGKAYWLSTIDKYGDFELRLSYMLGPKGNSGIFIRVPSYKGRTSVEGMEIQLLDDGSKKGKPGKGDTGAIYRVVAPSEFVSRPAGQWNDLQILCRGDQVRVTLNGKRINEANMAAHEQLAKRPRSGYIGLSAHSHVVKFKDVRIRQLGDQPSQGK